MNAARRLLPLLLLALPIRAALLIGPEKPASASVPAPSTAAEQPLAVATDGKDFVVLWSVNQWGYESMSAAKVTETGEVSPMPAHRVTTGSVTLASMVWTGEAYLVLWTAGSTVMAARLDRDANVIDTPFAVASGTVHALAWDGRRAVAITNDYLGMKVLVLGPTGNVVRETRLLGERVIGDVSLLAVDGGFVEVWASNFSGGVANVYAMRLSPDGDPLAKVKFPFPTSSGVTLDAEADGDRVGVAYTQWRAEGAAIEPQPLRRYTLDAQTLAITTHEATKAFDRPQVVATPGGFVSAVIARAATLDVVPFASTNARPNEIGPAGTILRTASNGRVVLAVWSRGYIAGAIFDATLTRRETPILTVSATLAPQSGPQLARAGDIALLTWGESAVESFDLMAARVDRFGNRLGAPQRIAGGELGAHAVAFTGEVWLVAYEAAGSNGEPHTSVRRVGLDGVPLDEPPLDFQWSLRPAMASNGEITFLSFLTTQGQHLYRFSRAGTLIDTEPILLSGFGNGALAGNGHDFLMAWWGNDGVTAEAKIVAKRIDANGNVLDAAPIVIDDAPAHASEVSVASDGTDYAVVFQRRTGELVVKRVSGSGVLQGSTPNGGGAVIGEGIAPRIAFLGSRVVVSFVSRPGPARLVLVEVGQGPIVIAESNLLTHALESGGTSLWLAYSRVPDRDSGIARVYVRSVSDAPSRRRTARQ
ncbi:MAG TPA: hypothetical protein VM733_10795 [Thermoanaerobaculia bacterium]|nr:hypothetical protein [Thermoanaerobaculia bacterium]